MPEHNTVHPSSMPLGSLRTTIAIALLAIVTLTISPSAALALDFLQCNQRPHSHESAASTPPVLQRVSSATSVRQNLLRSAAVGCSAQAQIVPAAQSDDKISNESQNDEQQEADIPILLATHRQLTETRMAPRQITF
jgi:hypothetical protein